jgi:hypothetical protein
LQQLLQLRCFTSSHAVAGDALVQKARQQLEEIRAAGTFKVERQITTPQAASVGVLDVAQPVLNFCEYAAATAAVPFGHACMERCLSVPWRLREDTGRIQVQ